MMHKLSIVIPVYNEKQTLLQLLERVRTTELHHVEKEILVVDDGSTDGTRELLQAHRDMADVVIFHKHNQGKGAAVRTGAHAATGDYVVVQDADLEYNPEDLNVLIAAVHKKNALAVFGSRRLGLKLGMSTRGSAQFYFGGLLVTYAANFLYGLRLTDEPTCYKMVESRLLRDLHLEAQGFEFCPEVTAKLARRGVVIHEVPISYSPRSTAEGKKIKFRDGLIALWTLLKYRV